MQFPHCRCSLIRRCYYFIIFRISTPLFLINKIVIDSLNIFFKSCFSVTLTSVILKVSFKIYNYFIGHYYYYFFFYYNTEKLDLYILPHSVFIIIILKVENKVLIRYF